MNEWPATKIEMRPIDSFVMKNGCVIQKEQGTMEFHGLSVERISYKRVHFALFAEL